MKLSECNVGSVVSIEDEGQYAMVTAIRASGETDVVFMDRLGIVTRAESYLWKRHDPVIRLRGRGKEVRTVVWEEF